MNIFFQQADQPTRPDEENTGPKRGVARCETHVDPGRSSILQTCTGLPLAHWSREKEEEIRLTIREAIDASAEKGYWAVWTTT